jgi:hypothetical protein
MRVPEEPVCIDLFGQFPVFTSLLFKSPVHVHRLWGLNQQKIDIRLFFKAMTDYALNRQKKCHQHSTCGTPSVHSACFAAGRQIFEIFRDA